MLSKDLEGLHSRWEAWLRLTPDGATVPRRLGSVYPSIHRYGVSETQSGGTGWRRLVDPVRLALGDDEQCDGVDGGGTGDAVGVDLTALHP